jgi:hypothetical protein
MLSLDVKIKESLERDNLLHCEAIVVAWLAVASSGTGSWLAVASSTGS